MERPEVTLAYVSGRHLASVQAAIEEFQLPLPDYAVCDVGSSIFRCTSRSSGATEFWHPLESWRAHLSAEWPAGSVDVARELLRDLTELTLQEPERQSEFKLSYYVPILGDPSLMLNEVRQRLAGREVNASLVYSVDDGRQSGLLDLLPAASGKRAAIEHLLREMELTLDQAFFAGDSGNDREVLVSPIPAVLVANASEELRAEVLEAAQRSGNAQRLYLAHGAFRGMNGNYAAGILEGLAHYLPETEAWWV